VRELCFPLPYVGRSIFPTQFGPALFRPFPYYLLCFSERKIKVPFRKSGVGTTFRNVRHQSTSTINQIRASAGPRCSRAKSIIDAMVEYLCSFPTFLFSFSLFSLRSGRGAHRVYRFSRRRRFIGGTGRAGPGRNPAPAS